MCPVCDREGEAERRPLGDAVYVFCCERCMSEVVLAFAAHGSSSARSVAVAGPGTREVATGGG